MSQDLPTGLEGFEVLEEDRFGGPRVPFTKPHTSLEQFTVDISRSLKRTFPTDPRRYDSVHVLLLRWADDDLGTEREIKDLDSVFSDTYHYTTERGIIPSKISHAKLEHMITCFRDSRDSPDNLLILYYGGHGVRDFDNKSIWAA